MVRSSSCDLVLPINQSLGLPTWEQQAYYWTMLLYHGHTCASTMWASNCRIIAMIHKCVTGAEGSRHQSWFFAVQDFLAAFLRILCMLRNAGYGICQRLRRIPAREMGHHHLLLFLYHERRCPSTLRYLESGPQNSGKPRKEVSCSLSNLIRSGEDLKISRSFSRKDL